MTQNTHKNLGAMTAERGLNRRGRSSRRNRWLKMLATMGAVSLPLGLVTLRADAQDPTEQISVTEPLHLYPEGVCQPDECDDSCDDRTLREKLEDYWQRRSANHLAKHQMKHREKYMYHHTKHNEFLYPWAYPFGTPTYGYYETCWSRTPPSINHCPCPPLNTAMPDQWQNLPAMPAIDTQPSIAPPIQPDVPPASLPTKPYREPASQPAPSAPTVPPPTEPAKPIERAAAEVPIPQQPLPKLGSTVLRSNDPVWLSPIDLSKTRLESKEFLADVPKRSMQSASLSGLGSQEVTPAVETVTTAKSESSRPETKVVLPTNLQVIRLKPPDSESSGLQAAEPAWLPPIDLSKKQGSASRDGASPAGVHKATSAEADTVVRPAPDFPTTGEVPSRTTNSFGPSAGTAR